MTISRRLFLLGAVGAVACTTLSGGLMASPAATPTGRKLVVVLLRGGLDGLSAVPPFGDKDYAAVRGELAVPPPGTTGGGTALDGRFGLHPGLAPLAPMWHSGELLALHGVATPFRSRSHFAVQDVVETGGATSGGREGWINRLAATIGANALATGPMLPLCLRGPAAAANWSPAQEAMVNPGLVLAASRMYAGDPVLGDLLKQGIRTQDFIDEVLDGHIAIGGGGRRIGADFPALLEAAGRVAAAPGGPDLVFVDDDGWDTHSNQVASLSRHLPKLADGLCRMRAAMASCWADTAVVVVTEFGRTVAPNGAAGSDHGTGGPALLLGGRVAGGRVAGALPVIGRDPLFEGRDIPPAVDMRALFKGVLAGHLGLGREVIDTVFQGAADVPALNGLLRT